MSGVRKPSSNESEPIKSDILAQLVNIHIDLANTKPIITYITAAYNQLIDRGYIVGSGDRSLMRKMITAEEKNGFVLDLKSVKKLDSLLDIFESYEQTLPLGQHDQIYTVVSYFNKVAGSILDVREDEAKLENAFQANIEVCQSYFSDKNKHVQLFALSLSQQMSQVHLSLNSTVQEKTEVLTELAHGMAMLKLLLDQIMNIEVNYKASKGSGPNPNKVGAIAKLQENILICVAESSRMNPEPERWFHFLWTQVEEYAKKCVASETTLKSGLYSPRLSSILKKHILNDRSLSEFAIFCAKIAPNQPVQGQEASAASAATRSQKAQ
jgi:hypothetical protein